MKKSAEALVAAFVIGVASAASWDLMKRFISRLKETIRLSVTYLELEEGSGRRGKAWKVEGDPKDVVKAIDALREGPACGEPSMRIAARRPT